MTYLMIYYCLVCWVAAALLKDGDILTSWVEVAFSPLVFPYKVGEVVAYEVRTSARRSGL